MLKELFNPKSVALIGATDRKGSVGLGLSKNLLEGEKDVFFVNPNKEEVLERKSYSNIKQIEEEIDLVVIGVPSSAVLEVAKDCVEKQVSAAVVISAGFSESGKKGKKREKKLKQIFRKENIPFLGPNCLGIISPEFNLNASFAPFSPKGGNVGFISQSGALIDSVIEKSKDNNLGFSSLVSFGNQAGVSVSSLIEFLGEDKNTDVISLYLEGLKGGRGPEFIKKAKKATKNKPILVLKGGKQKKGKQAASSHSGSLAGDSEIYSAAFKKSGILEVENIQELLSLSYGFSLQETKGKKVSILTNGGAAGVKATDICEKNGISLVSFSEKIKQRIKERFSKQVTCLNPLDILGDATQKDYFDAGEIILSGETDILLVLQTIQFGTNSKGNAQEIASLKEKFPKKNIVTCFLGGKTSQKGVSVLEEKSVPCFENLSQAVLFIKAAIERVGYLD